MRASSQLLLTFLLNACWQIVFLAAAVALSARLLRDSAIRFQHLLWVLALVLSFTLPLVTTAFVSRGAFFATATPVVEGPTPDLALAIDPAPLDQERSLTPLPETHSGIRLTENQGLLVLAAYFLFLAYRGVRFFRAWQRTRRIKRGARVVEPSENLQPIIDACQSALRIGHIPILASAAVAVPLTVGVRRPLVIVPEQLLRDADDELLTSAIGHELVHVRRRDYLLNLIYEFIYLPLSFHPAAALVRRRINQTRELCCDEQVADRILKADVYARSLVRLAGTTPPLRNPLPTTTVGIADADILEVRIMSLMNRSETRRSGKKLLLIAVALILAVPCITAAAFNLQLDITDVPQASPGSVTIQQPDSTTGTRKVALVSRTVAADQEGPRVKTSEANAGPVTVVTAGDAQEVQQDKQAQEEREARERALKERAERDPEFRAKLEQKEREEREVRQRIEREIEEIKRGLSSTTNPEERAKLEKLLQERIEQLRGGANGFAMARESRGAGVAAAKWARITMAQAIQIANSQTPGAVLQCSLIGEREDRVFYHVVIFSGSEENPVTTHVLVNAVNGAIFKSERARPEISGGLLNGKALKLPSPQYPEIAKQAHATGSVKVEVTVDEAGNVISATAVSGHPLLQAASVAAARAAQFQPTKLNGEPVKVRGVLTYNFAAQ